jgi:hypothetical protein
MAYEISNELSVDEFMMDRERRSFKDDRNENLEGICHENKSNQFHVRLPPERQNRLSRSASGFQMSFLGPKRSVDPTKFNSAVF